MDLDGMLPHWGYSSKSVLPADLPTVRQEKNVFDVVFGRPIRCSWRLLFSHPR